MSDAIFRACGGRPEVPPHLMAAVGGVAELNPADVTWNFGVKPPPEGVPGPQPPATMYARFPNLQGAWDGKTTVNHWLAAQKVLGDRAEDLIQYQPRGTCGGRSGSATGDLVQCVQIAAGQRAKFHRCSHAAVYFAARKKYGMLGGSWQNENNDGVASGSVPEALQSVAGYVQREEDGDTTWYGPGSDDLACKLGAGLLPDVQAKILSAGADNFITAYTPVSSAQELADGIAAGGIGLGSDNQGFTMTRDSEGLCSPSGQWSHYQLRCGVGVTPRGRRYFAYFQSWGKTTPGGPALPGYPGNCFGVDFDVMDRIIRSGDWGVVHAFPLWDLEKGPVDIPWAF